MINAIIIGQSHTVCMSAAAAANPRWSEISIYRLRSGDKQNDQDALSGDDAVELIQKLDDNVNLFLSIPGSYHNIIGLVRPQLDFDFLLRAEDPLLDETYLIPRRVISDAFDQHLETETLVPKLKAASSGRVYLLACPPPKQDNEFMMKCLLAKWNKPYRGQDISANGLNRPELRRKLWALECERMKAWAQRLDICFVPVPSAGLNDEGFLAEQFYAKDATHANANFGMLMLELVASVVSQPQGPK